MKAINEKFVDLGEPRRIWAIAAIQGDYDRLITLHDSLAKRFGPRDRLVYMGNYLGNHQAKNRKVYEEILAFRAALLTKSGMEPQDIVYLRGPAEEAWQRLLRLQFTPQPVQMLEHLVNSGVEGWLQLCGVSLNDTRTVTRAGSLAITRWTNQLRQQQRMVAGLEAMMSGMRRASILKLPESSPLSQMLFVPAGYDFGRSLEDQGEHLWWSDRPYNPAAYLGDATYKVVRGFDARRGGVQTDGLAITLDGGCGTGGPLVCGCFNATGQLLEIVTVGGQQLGQLPAAASKFKAAPVSLPRKPAAELPTLQTAYA